MNFSEKGFDKVIVDFEYKYLNWFNYSAPRPGGSTSSVESFDKSNYGISFELSNYFLTDRQSAKKMFLKRDIKLKDSDVNKSIFGSDVEKNVGQSYAIWKSDNDLENPEIVKISESMTDDLDSPYIPLSSLSEIYEFIDDIKNRLKYDFFNIEYLNIYTDDEIKRANETFNRITEFSKNPDIKNAPSSVILLGLLGLVESVLSILQNIKLNLVRSRRFITNSKYLEFVIIPDKLNDVVSYLSTLLDLLIVKEDYVNRVQSLVIEYKNSLISSASGLISIDVAIEEANTTFSSAATGAAALGPGAGSALATANGVFELAKSESQSQKANILSSLSNVSIPNTP